MVGPRAKRAAAHQLITELGLNGQAWFA